MFRFRTRALGWACSGWSSSSRVTSSAFLLVTAIVLSVLAGPADAQPKIISVELLPNNCSVMQDVLDDVGAEFAKVAGTTQLVSQPLLDRLAAAGMEKIEAFFRCFGLNEGHVSKRRMSRDVVRVITTDEFPIARVRFKKDWYPLIIEQVVCVGFVLEQKRSGTLIAWGGYSNCR